MGEARPSGDDLLAAERRRRKRVLRWLRATEQLAGVSRNTAPLALQQRWVDTLVDAIGVPHGALYAVDLEVRKLRRLAHAGVSPLPECMPLEAGLEQALASSPAAVVNPTDASDAWAPLGLSPLLWGVVPTAEGGRIVAVLGHDAATAASAPPFDDDDLSCFRVLCSQLEVLHGVVEAIGHLRSTHERLEATLAQLEQTQAQLVERERLAAIGELSAGVAHEINNPTTYVAYNVEELAEMAARSGDPDASRCASEARDGLDRITRLVSDLTRLTRRGSPELRPHDISRVARDALRIVDNRLRHAASVELDLHKGLLVAADEPRLGQVFINLLVNASQVVEASEAARGRIEVRSFARDGQAVVQVSDSGTGVPEELRERVFQPFVTTKPAGEGTGLGLSIAQSIVHEHGGRIALVDGALSGATFEVALPRLDVGAPASSDHRVESEFADDGLAAWRVLLVDDDPLVRTSHRAMLERICHVDAAASGQEALELIGGGRRYDAVLCDLLMPHMDGMDLYDEVAASDPAAAWRFIFVTGGAFTERSARFVDDGSHPVLYKPLTVEKLAEALTRLRDDVEGAPPSF